MYCLPKQPFFRVDFIVRHNQLKHSDIALIEECQTDQVYQFSYHGVQGAHKIQLLTYSCNVQRAVEVELSLKSKRESEKEKRARHYKHIQAHQRVPTVVEFSLAAIFFNAFMNDNE